MGARASWELPWTDPTGPRDADVTLIPKVPDGARCASPGIRFVTNALAGTQSGGSPILLAAREISDADHLIAIMLAAELVVQFESYEIRCSITSCKRRAGGYRDATFDDLHAGDGRLPRAARSSL